MIEDLLKPDDERFKYQMKQFKTSMIWATIGLVLGIISLVLGIFETVMFIFGGCAILVSILHYIWAYFELHSCWKTKTTTPKG